MTKNPFIIVERFKLPVLPESLDFLAEIDDAQEENERPWIIDQNMNNDARNSGMNSYNWGIKPFLPNSNINAMVNITETESGNKQILNFLRNLIALPSFNSLISSSATIHFFIFSYLEPIAVTV